MLIYDFDLLPKEGTAHILSIWLAVVTLRSPSYATAPMATGAHLSNEELSEFARARRAAASSGVS